MERKLSEEEGAKYIEWLQTLAMDNLSLFTPIGEEGDSVLQDFIEDTEQNVEREVLISERNNDLDEVIRSLSPREEMVIRLRYGLGKETKGLTLEQIGEKFGLTRERIRQVEKSAMRKIKIRMIRKGYSEKDLH